MNLKDTCALDGISLTEGKLKYNLTHWKQEVVIADASEVIETESKQEAPKPSPILKVPEVPHADKIKSCRGLGTKSPYWKELNA